MSDCALEPPQDLAKAVAKATAKRPRRSTSRPGSASSGSKSGGGRGGNNERGTANNAMRIKLVSRGKTAAAPEDDDATTTPPALFFYSNLHDAVRAELSALLASVAVASSSSPVSSENAADVDVDVDERKTDAPTTTTPMLPAASARSIALADVAARARLLEKVHAYHSAVEDEVIYPALEAKVANVTLSYQVEHEDEGRLLDELVSLARSASAADAVAAAAAAASKAAAAPSSNDRDDAKATAAASSRAAATASAAVRRLSRKAAEVEATLGKHLAKEEAQLLPLVLSAFDSSEQARLVAQFLCSIPLSSVRDTLAWLRRASDGGGGGGYDGSAVGTSSSASVSAAAAANSTSTSSSSASAQSRVAGAVAGALPSGPLAELVASWLSEAKAPSNSSGEREAEEGNEKGEGDGACGKCAGCRECGLSPSSLLPSTSSPSAASPPLRHIAVLHAALGASLRAFAADARSLAATAAADQSVDDGEDKSSSNDAAASAAAALPAMAERLRFLRSVLAYHAASEDDVLMPVARRLAAGASSGGAPSEAAKLAAAALAAEEEHHHHSHHHHHHHRRSDEDDDTDDDGEGGKKQQKAAAAATNNDGKHGGDESACLERVGVLLNDVRARARRGGARSAVAASLASLAEAADGAASAISHHMELEEKGVLPALQRGLCAPSQAFLLWEALRSMPARVLRSLLPWLASCLGVDAARELVDDATQAAPREHATEVWLLRSWCDRLCASASASVAVAAEDEEEELLLLQQPKQKKRARVSSAAAVEEVDAPAAAAAGPSARKRDDAAAAAAPAPTTFGDGDAPIDHIFQFHKALRRDLRAMESQVAAFADALDAEGGSGWRAEEEEGTEGETKNDDVDENTDSSKNSASPAAAKALEGRFRFLQGVYRAHSDAEDNIVFPALEAREALRRVSHAYTLDHEQESALFKEVERELSRLRRARDLGEARTAARDLAARTAALRASLETHVTAEERELWPLFAENFTVDEQEALVGTIVGRTGAEVLAATLPWVAAATTPSEAASMWESLRSAARGTAFDDWLRASRTVEEEEEAARGSGGGGGGGNGKGDDAKNDDGASASPGRKKALSASAATTPCRAAQPGDALDAVVEYLGLAGEKSGSGREGEGAVAVPATTTKNDDASDRAKLPRPPPSPTPLNQTFRPGWEAIFAMNQAQLEAAVRMAWTDESLEPARRSYLAQNIMAARFVVSQQLQQEKKKEQRDQQHPPRPRQRQQQQQQKPPSCSPQQQCCPHYSRRTRVVAPCCERAHGCRHCHDEAEDHSLVPSQVSQMLCAHCGSRGPAASDCARCGKRQARYYCGICRLWDDTPGRDIYHCPFCNLCRLGKGLGVDAQHCMRCNSCMALHEHKSHACKKGLESQACPACSEPLFDSTKPYRQFPCGHGMHSHCFEGWARSSYACPLCRRSVGDMRAYWRMLDALLERDRRAVEGGSGIGSGNEGVVVAGGASSSCLPPSLASKKQPILCNDCGERSDAAFHFVYHKCGGCGSYNTTLL